MNDLIVVGIGNPYRGDDGLGHAAAEMIGRQASVEVILADGEATRLVDSWESRRVAIVVDAIRRGDPPGTIHRFDGTEPLPAAFAHPSTHGAGLESAVALGRALDRMPEALIIYGIEPHEMTAGRGLSEAVTKSMPVLVDRVVSEVRALCA